MDFGIVSQRSLQRFSEIDLTWALTTLNSLLKIRHANPIGCFRFAEKSVGLLDGANALLCERPFPACPRPAGA